LIDIVLLAGTPAWMLCAAARRGGGVIVTIPVGVSQLPQNFWHLSRAAAHSSQGIEHYELCFLTFDGVFEDLPLQNLAVGRKSESGAEVTMPPTLEAQMKATYFRLRVTLAVLAFLLPPLLWREERLSGFLLEIA
jgi:hypothetical protein